MKSLEQLTVVLRRHGLPLRSTNTLPHAPSWSRPQAFGLALANAEVVFMLVSSEPPSPRVRNAEQTVAFTLWHTQSEQACVPEHLADSVRAA